MSNVDPFANEDFVLFPPSNLIHRVAEPYWDKEIDHWLLVVSFSGEYLVGSAGNPDAEYMVAVLGAAIARIEPLGVVFDLRDLDYRWGNSLMNVFACVERWESPDNPPFTVAAGPRCLPALQSLVTPCGAQPPAVLHADLESAIEDAFQLAAEWSARRV